MITLKDYLRGEILENQSEEIQKNIPETINRVNALLADAGLDRKPTSGLRTKEHHKEVYRKLAIQRGIPFEKIHIPWGSHHLDGGAVDVEDHDGKLREAVIADDYALLRKHQLYIEAKDDQARVHFQIFAPASGKIEFKP